jgi:hypothetical protein
VLLVLVAEQIDQLGSAIDDPAVLLLLGVEDAEDIRLQPAL